MKSYITEFIGTFFLVLIIGLCVIEPGAGIFSPLAIGLGLAAIIYAGGHISGAHYNPAITLAVYLRGKCSLKDVPFYVAAQALGAVIAALIVNIIKSGASVPAIALNIPKALLVEFIFTFALSYVILNVATAKSTAGNSYFGLAIGITVTAGAYSAAAISGAAFNPAVALAFTIFGLSSLNNIWIYLLANFSGAAAAAVVFKQLVSD